MSRVQERTCTWFSWIMASRIWGTQNSCIWGRKTANEIASFMIVVIFSRIKIQEGCWFPPYGFFPFYLVLSSLSTRQKSLQHRWAIQASCSTSSVMSDTPRSDYHSDSGQDKKFNAQCGVWGGDREAFTIQLWQKLFCACVSDLSGTWKTSFAIPWYEINFFYYF